MSHDASILALAIDMVAGMAMLGFAAGANGEARTRATTCFYLWLFMQVVLLRVSARIL